MFITTTSSTYNTFNKMYLSKKSISDISGAKILLIYYIKQNLSTF